MVYWLSVIEFNHNQHGDHDSVHIVTPTGQVLDRDFPSAPYGADAGPPVEYRPGFAPEALTSVTLNNVTHGLSWSYPNPDRFLLESRSGFDSVGKWVGVQWWMEDVDVLPGGGYDIAFLVRSYLQTTSPPCRLYPREDGLGASSATRQYPPPRGKQSGFRKIDYY